MSIFEPNTKINLRLMDGETNTERKKERKTDTQTYRQTTDRQTNRKLGQGGTLKSTYLVAAPHYNKLHIAHWMCEKSSVVTETSRNKYT